MTTKQLLVRRSDTKIKVEDDLELAVSLFTTDEGGTKKILCVHGLGGQRHIWNNFSLQMAMKGVTVASFDLRGHGESQPSSSSCISGLSMRELGRDIDRVLDHLGWSRGDEDEDEDEDEKDIFIVGHSYGANLVLEWVNIKHKAKSIKLRGIVCVDGGYINLQRNFENWNLCRERMIPPAITENASQLPEMLMQWFPKVDATGINALLASYDMDVSSNTAVLRLNREAHTVLLEDLWHHAPLSHQREVGDEDEEANTTTNATSTSSTTSNATTNNTQLDIPILLIVTGDKTAFSQNKKMDVEVLQNTREEKGKEIERQFYLPLLTVRWFEDQTHFFPIEDPNQLQSVVFDYISEI